MQVFRPPKRKPKATRQPLKQKFSMLRQGQWHQIITQRAVYHRALVVEIDKKGCHVEWPEVTHYKGNISTTTKREYISRDDIISFKVFRS